jgi:phage baseplate assembly protein W
VDAKAFLGRGWAYPVQAQAMGADVVLAEHEEDIRQAVRIILETGRGERVMRPDFGAGLDDFLFEPLNTTTRALIEQRVREALVTWEPRIRVEAVDATIAGDARSRLDIRIEYRVRATNTFYNLVYPFYAQEGGEEGRA